MSIIVVVGEQGCGKTENTQKIGEHFKAFAVIDSGDLSADLMTAKTFVTEKIVRKVYDDIVVMEENIAFGKTVVILTNEEITMPVDYRRIDQIVHYRSMNLA